MPKVSIVLPTYNGSKYIAESIQSVINQSFTDWELIIINDCSTDCTLDIAHDFATRDARIKVFTNEKNLKLPASLNEGFHRANGMYYTWTSDDNCYKENALAEMVHALDTMNDVGMVYCNMDTIDSEGNYIGEWPSAMPEILAERNIIGACFLYRSDIAKKIGGYDVNLFLAEDYEYWLRMWSYVKIAKIDKHLYEYRQHKSSLTASQDIEYILQQVAKAKYAHLQTIIAKINDWNILCFLYNQMRHAPIKLTRTDIEAFRRKEMQLPVPHGASKLFPSFHVRVYQSIKKIIKAILPYGVVKLIQKCKKNNRFERQ